MKKDRDIFIARCACGVTLHLDEDFDESRTIMKQEGWKSYKNDMGEWVDQCPDC